jgi:hypothetical protein
MKQMCGGGTLPADRAPTLRNRWFADSLLEEDGFEPSVPLLRKALLGVANRRRRHERRSHLQVRVRNGNACLEWLPIAFTFAEGPRVRISLPPAESQERTCVLCIKDVEQAALKQQRYCRLRRAD